MEKIARICLVFALVLFALAGILMMTGCSSTSVITEYDAEGHIVKKTETKESVVEQVVASTKDKSVLVWHDGWIYGVRTSVVSSDNPLPTVEIIAKKANDGILTIHQNQQNLTEFPAIIKAAKNTDPLSATASGVSSGTKGTAE